MGTTGKLFNLWRPPWNHASAGWTLRLFCRSVYVFRAAQNPSVHTVRVHCARVLWAWLFASLSAASCDGTIAGFCLASPWEEGDRGVNEWRGFRDASAQGHDEGVGGWALYLNNEQRNSHSVASLGRHSHNHRRTQSTKVQVKLSHSSTFPVTYGELGQKASINDGVFGVGFHRPCRKTKNECYGKC